MTLKEKLTTLVKRWKDLVEALRELFDAIASTFDMLGCILVETYDRYKMALRSYRRRIRKAYRRKRKGRW